MQCFGGSCSLHDNLKSPPLLGRKEKRLIILSSCFTDLKICYGNYSKSTRHFDFDFESSIPVNCEKSSDNNYFFPIG